MDRRKLHGRRLRSVLRHRRLRPALTGLAVASLLSVLAGCGGTERVHPPGAEPRLTLRAEPTELVSVDGAPATARLVAEVERADGVSEEVGATLSVIEGSDAVLDAGTLRAAARAGQVTVEARHEVEGREQVAVLALEVRVRRHGTAGPVDFDAATRFDEDPRVDVDRPFITHPVDGAVVPATVGALSIAWLGGEVGDHYRVRAVSGRVELTSLLRRDDAGVPLEARFDSEGWARLLEDGRGGAIELRVDRLGDDGVALGTPATVRVGEGALFGEAIAWTVREAPAASGLVRVPLQATTSEAMADFGAAECTGCHAVGADGARMVVNRDLATSVLVDLETGRLVDGFATDRPIDAASFGPDGGFLVASTREWPGSLPPAPSMLEWLDGATGEAVPATGLPAAPAGSPVVLGDGSALLYVEGGHDGPGGTGEPTRLVRVPILGDAELGPSEVLADGEDLRDAPEGGATLSRPAATEDGSVVVFAHGTHSRSANGATSALYAWTDGGDPVRLARGAPPDSETATFWPAVASGRDGDVWVLYYAPGADARRKLWMTALDRDELAEGRDPSAPPFLLPGQGSAEQVMAPAWKAGACLEAEVACRLDADCCSGTCRAGGTAAWRCGPTP